MCVDSNKISDTAVQLHLIMLLWAPSTQTLLFLLAH